MNAWYNKHNPKFCTCFLEQQQHYMYVCVWTIVNKGIANQFVPVRPNLCKTAYEQDWNVTVFSVFRFESQFRVKKRGKLILSFYHYLINFKLVVKISREWNGWENENEWRKKNWKEMSQNMNGKLVFHREEDKLLSKRR